MLQQGTRNKVHTVHATKHAQLLLQQTAHAAHRIQSCSTTHATAATAASDRHCCLTQALQPIQKSKHTACQPHPAEQSQHLLLCPQTHHQPQAAHSTAAAHQWLVTSCTASPALPSTPLLAAHARTAAALPAALPSPAHLRCCCCVSSKPG